MSCAALAPICQTMPPAASRARTAVGSGTDADAISTAFLLSMSPHLNAWPLPCVNEHDAAAPESCPDTDGRKNVHDSQLRADQAEPAKDAGDSPAAGDSGDTGDPAHDTVGSGTLFVRVDTPAVSGAPPQEQEQQHSGAAGSTSQAGPSEDDVARRAVCPAPSAMPWPTGAALAEELIARHRDKLLLPIGSCGQPRPTCRVAMATVPSVFVELRSQSQAPGVRADLSVEEAARLRGLANGHPREGIQYAATAMNAAAVIAPPHREPGCEGDSDDSEGLAASAALTGASPHESDGGDARASDADFDGAHVGQHFLPSAAEAEEACPCPGNPFEAARMQYKDDTEDRLPPTSVRRRTPTPLLSTLRPDYRGREHPLLRW